MGKILIVGPGRSGSTFLVQLLTRLGFDTGWEPFREPYFDHVRAGCEWRIELDLAAPHDEWRKALSRLPRILKTPEWSLVLKHFVQNEIIEVDHVFIPLRDLDIAAKSRLDVGLDWHVEPTDDYDYKLMDQASVHALALGRAVEVCEIFNIPYTIMKFPDFVENGQYCWQKLSEGLKIDRGEFSEIFSGLAKPEKIKWRN